MLVENRKKGSVTVKDIAKHAGLSPSTVSAVLNNRHVERRISPPSIQKVLSSARVLGYVPNIAARRLRAHDGGNRQVVLTILTSYEAPVLIVSQALHSLQKLIEKESLPDTTMSVAIEMFHAGRLKELPGLVDGKRFNGAIITNTVAEDDRFLATAHLPFPVVLLGRSIPGYPSVSERPERLGRAAAEILGSIGRRRLAVLCPRLLTQATQGRLAAFVEEGLKQTGKIPERIISEKLDETGGYRAMAAYLKGGGQCDGFFSVTDSLVVGAYHAIRQHGLRIPDDIAAVGVGDNEAGPYLRPPLTSFATAQAAMNDAAARTLMSLIKGESIQDLPKEVPVTTILRESTGHPPDRSRRI